jgi:hypothetical protein
VKIDSSLPTTLENCTVCAINRPTRTCSTVWCEAGKARLLLCFPLPSILHRHCMVAANGMQHVRRTAEAGATVALSCTRPDTPGKEIATAGTRTDADRSHGGRTWRSYRFYDPVAVTQPQLISQHSFLPVPAPAPSLSASSVFFFPTHASGARD